MDEPGVWSQIESLYRADFRRFERVARAVVGDRESALDAVQEGFADALRHAGQRTGHGSLEGWVWRCSYAATGGSLWGADRCRCW